MASLIRHQTDKVGVFYILGKPRVTAKGKDIPAAVKPDKSYYTCIAWTGKRSRKRSAGNPSV
jgi:hypothetical protein